MSVCEVQKSSRFSVSKDTICRQIVKKGTVVQGKIKKKPALKSHHKLQIMLWVQNLMSYG